MGRRSAIFGAAGRRKAVAVSGPVLYRDRSQLSNTGGTLAVPRPATLAVADLMVAFQIGDNDAALADMGNGAGFALFGEQAGAAGAAPYEKIWSKVATSGDVSASTFSFTNAGAGIHHSVGIIALQAGTYNPNNPLAGLVFASGAAATAHVAPATTGAANGMLLTSHATDSGGTSASYSPPSGMDERVDTAPASGGYTALEVCSLSLAAGGSTGTKSATCTVSRPWKCASLIVNPL